MSAYTKAASFVLDSLWEDDSFRQYFYALGAELADLGRLSQIVFEPAYVRFKAALDADALFLLETQVTTDLLTPLQRQPGFREMWAAWDETTREEFIREQSELQLAKLLIQVYDRQLADCYQNAYRAYLEARKKE
jgi:hypothetical protein